jgi:hypothetical protein
MIIPELVLRLLLNIHEEHLSITNEGFLLLPWLSFLLLELWGIFNSLWFYLSPLILIDFSE